MWALDGLVL